MIVTVNCPAGAHTVKYGQASMLPESDGSIDVPAYVAKTLLGVSGFSTGASLSGTAASILNGLSVSDQWEAIYILRAYGKQVSGDPATDWAAAKALMSANGEPAASAA